MITSVLIVLKHLIYGGTEKYTLTLANTLAEKGIRVTLVSGDGPLASHVSPKVHLFIMPISRKPRIKQITEKRILEIARDCKPQIIHTQCRTSLVCTQLARETLNIPLVTHEHHTYESQDYPFIISELRDGADKIIAITPYTEESLIKHGIEKDQIISIRNGVDTKHVLPITSQERKDARKSLKLSPKDKVILCLSRIEPGKGIDKLMMAFVQIASKIPEAKLIIAGDDQNNLVKPYLRNLISQNMLQKRVFIFNGTYDIRKYHAAADIFCYPAISKGMAVMEAMAAGLPVVGKETKKQPFVVEDGISGLMTKPTAQYRIDPGEIAQKLCYLLEQPALTRKMGKAARAKIKKDFPVESVIKNVLCTYTDVVNTYVSLSQNTSEAFMNHLLLQ